MGIRMAENFIALTLEFLPILGVGRSVVLAFPWSNGKNFTFWHGLLNDALVLEAGGRQPSVTTRSLGHCLWDFLGNEIPCSSWWGVLHDVAQWKCNERPIITPICHAAAENPLSLRPIEQRVNLPCNQEIDIQNRNVFLRWSSWWYSLAMQLY